MTTKVVLITGVADYWGSRLADRLKTEPKLHLIGLDAVPPETDLKGLDFVQADVRDPLLAELFRSEHVHTVCHLRFTHSVRHSPATFDANVIGTRKLLKACADACVCKVVLKSSTTVYGAHPNNAAFLTEKRALRASTRYAYTKHLQEIEEFCDDFRRQAPELMLTSLRFANILGPTADTPMTRFLTGRCTPTLLGFDPMLQIIHEDDVTEALTHAILNDHPGAFNVATQGAMPLSRILGLCGALPLPVLHPVAYWGAKLLASAGLDLDNYLPIEPDYLRYPWISDLTKMHDEFRFSPRYSAEETVRDFVAQSQPKRRKLQSDVPVSDEDRLRATIERRRKAKE